MANNADVVYKSAYDNVMNAINTKTPGAMDLARKSVAALNGTDGAFGIGEFSKQLDGVTPIDYKAQATNQYDPIYQSKITNAKNSLASMLAGYDAQTGSLTNNYNQGVANSNTNFQTGQTNQRLNNQKAENNYSNTMLGRGLARSSIVGTGLGEMDNINNRVLNQNQTAQNQNLQNMQTAYQNSLAGIQGQRQAAINNEANTEADLANTRDMSIADLARTLEQNDWTKNNTIAQQDWQKSYQQQGLDANTKAEANKVAEQTKQDALNQEQFDWNKNVTQQQLDLAKQQAAKTYSSGGYTTSGSGSTGSSGSSPTVTREQSAQHMGAIDDVTRDTSLSAGTRIDKLNAYATQMDRLGYTDLANYARQQVAALYKQIQPAVQPYSTVGLPNAYANTPSTTISPTQAAIQKILTSSPSNIKYGKKAY